MRDLLKMYSFESVHNTEQETALADWICKWLTKHNVTDYERDGNNIYRFKEMSGPILSAHLDQVKTNGRAEHFYQDNQGHIRGYTKDFEQTSLGGDDKNGVWIILKLLEEGINIDFIISAGEEVGCLGIKLLDAHDILEKNITPNRFCLVLDRRGSTDVLSGGGGTTYCKTLAQDICNYLNDMSVTIGSLSDTATICGYCESVNMSVAYEAPHTSAEHTDFNRLLEIKEYVKKLCTDFVHYSTKPSVYTAVSTYSRRGKKNEDFAGYYDKYYGGSYYGGF